MADWKNEMCGLAREVWVDVVCGVCDDADDAICEAVDGCECVILTHYQITVWSDEGDHDDLSVGEGEGIATLLHRNALLHCLDAAREAYADLPDSETCRKDWLAEIASSALDTSILAPDTPAPTFGIEWLAEMVGFDDARLDGAADRWFAEWLSELSDRVVDCATMICERGHESAGEIDPEPLPEDFDELRVEIRGDSDRSPLPTYYESLFVETWRAVARALNAQDET